MLCYAAQHDPIGYVAIDGEGLAADDIARMVGIESSQASTLIAELERNGVLSRNTKGTIYSRRMVRDAKASKKAKENGQKGGNPNLRKQKTIPPPDNQPLKSRLNGEVKPHMPDSSIQESNDRKVGEGAARGTQLDRLVERLIQAAGGNVVHGAYGIEVVQPILDLQALGCDLDTDVIPAIAEVVPKLDRPLRTWGARFIRDACLARQAARLRQRGNGGFVSGEPAREKLHELFIFYQNNKIWPFNPEIFGFEPGVPGSKITKEMIEEWSRS